MSAVQVSFTAVTTLVAVLLGGWLTLRSQDRSWRRDHQREWRDIRLAAYISFIDAFREYVAYVLRPDVKITSAPRPRPPYEPMPFFDEAGTPYRERLESSKTRLRLVSDRAPVVAASNEMIRHARLLAADRATHDVDRIPGKRFEQLWQSEREFVLAARQELGLATDFQISGDPRTERELSQAAG
jgi:hypothetical protein